jgi:DNA-binding NarL/FixJ family response regulator
VGVGTAVVFFVLARGNDLRIGRGGAVLDNRTSVMVVDDSEPWRRFVSSKLLKESTLQIVCEAADAGDAISEADKIQPNLILLDIGLPSLNGIEAAHQIRQVAPGSRILFVSEQSDPDVVTAALEAGGGGYVLKSDAGDELLPAIVAILRGDPFLSSRLKRALSSIPGVP